MMLFYLVKDLEDIAGIFFFYKIIFEKLQIFKILTKRNLLNVTKYLNPVSIK